MITLVKMKYFCDVVDSGSFTNAGKINHVSQTSITQQIHEIEKEVGYPLINRKVSPVKPTNLGKLFYSESKKVLSQYTLFKDNLQQYISNQSLKLTVGYTSLTDLRALEKLMTKLDYQDIDIFKENISEAAQKLKNGQYDLMISFASEFQHNSQIDTVNISDGHFVACVNKDHPLAKNKNVKMKEVYSYPLIMLNPRVIGKSYDVMMDKTKTLGLKPNVVQKCDDVSSELFLIKHNNYIGFLPEDYPIRDNEGLIKIKVLDSPHEYQIVIAKLKSNTETKVNKFFNRIKRLSHR